MTPEKATGSDAHPFVGFDVAALIALQGELHGPRVFLTWVPPEGPETHITYAAFVQAVRHVAAAMRRRGIRKRDRVLIHLENCPETVVSWFACAWLGATAVVTNARAAPAELAYFARHSGVVAAITQPKFLADVSAACPGLAWLAVTETDAGDPPAAGQKPDAALAFSVLLAETDLEPARAAEPLLPASIHYTSGTTSRPKGVVMTHANILWGGKVGSAQTGLRADDVFLIHLPLYHVIGFSYALLSTLWAGGRAVLVPRFSASRFWPVSVRHRCTWSAMVPFCVRALRDHDVPADHAYRAWGNAYWSAGLERRYNLNILGWWGMTEIITQGIVGDYGKPGHEMAIGRPAAAYRVAIRREDGTAIEPGDSGHLSIRGVRGVSLFAEYLDDPDATSASFDREGYFRTGDIVRLHEDGFIEFADRAKDMLKVGGENVAASEVERVILGVAGVREVAVVGKPHVMLGEVAVAFVVSGPGDRDDCRARIDAACRAQLAAYKLPREIRFIDELPRGMTEKVSKATLRTRAAADGPDIADGRGG